MASEFINFSGPALRVQQVLSLAKKEALRLNHSYVGTEHMLLGLIRLDGDVAGQVLSNLSIDLNKVRSTVEFVVGLGETPPLGEIGLTPRAKKVVELAMNEAHRMHHPHISTGHLLMGLMRVREGSGVRILETLGVILENVLAETMRILGAPSADIEESSKAYLGADASPLARPHPIQESAYQIAVVEHVRALINEIAKKPDFDPRSVADITIRLFDLRDELLALEKPEVAPDIETLGSLRALIHSIVQRAPLMKEPILKMLSHPIIAGAVGASFQRFLLS